jgi:hypothetical protein
VLENSSWRLVPNRRDPFDRRGETMSEREIYAPNREVTDLQECYFYHKTDIPGHGVVGGEWDLRGGEEKYLGGVSFAGKRVLELGTASGFLCRYMESKGADVVGFDLCEEGVWDIVPYAQVDYRNFATNWKKHIRRLNNGWWFCHKIFHSRAKVVYGNIYNIPETIGRVNIATFGSILLHLRDPFLALHNALRLTEETVVVTEIAPDQPEGSAFSDPKQKPSLSRKMGDMLRRIPSFLRSAKGKSESVNLPAPIFIPNSRQASEQAAVGAIWWILPPELIVRFLEIMGFENTKISYHTQHFMNGQVKLYTVIGKRTRSL